jgi:hypothetical protein
MEVRSRQPRALVTEDPSSFSFAVHQITNSVPQSVPQSVRQMLIKMMPQLLRCSNCLSSKRNAIVYLVLCGTGWRRAKISGLVSRMVMLGAAVGRISVFA